jgi:glycosyltransferase involved in cell wall biosynthesis
MDLLQKREYRDVVLFLLGSGPAEGAIRDLVKAHDLHGRVIIHPPVEYSEVPRYIAMSDIGLVPLPDLAELAHQCPDNLLEYLAMCKPVVVTDIACNRSIVGDSTCAEYVSQAVPGEFAKAIMNLDDRREHLNEIGAEGRHIVETNYTWSGSAKRLERFLNS